MQYLKIAGAVVAVLLLLFSIVGLFLPRDYSVERSIEIQGSRECPFDQVNDLEKSIAWSPWKQRDPTMVWTFGEKTVGAGASYTWTSQRGEGGAFEILASTPPERIETRVDFGTRGVAEGRWTFERERDRVIVTWGFRSEAQGIVDRYFGLFADALVGPDFENGLERIKQICEA